MPFRSGANPERQRNLAIILRWLADLPVTILLSEQSDSRDADISFLPDAVHVWESSSDPSSKAAACNAGVAAALTPVVALIDADTLVSPAALLSCVDRIAHPGDRTPIAAIRPFGCLVDLDDAATEKMHRTGVLPAAGSASGDASRALEHIPLAGGILVIDREAYLAVGGMDESFRGWGGEDDAFSHALIRSGVDSRILRDEVAFHLWHAREADDRYEHPHYAANAERARWWADCSDAEFAHAIAAGQEVLARRQR